VKDFKASPKKSSPSRQHWWKYFSKRKAVEALPLLPVKTAEDNEERESNPESEKPFELTDIALQVPKGSFVAIVGRVGSGKVRLRDVQP
jgi:ABC-type polysaccharide/polyol phosphate transport system ATPase subunit